MATAKRKKTETFQVKSEDILGRVKDLIREGNVRKISIKDKEGK